MPGPQSDPSDRNGEPAEDFSACLVMVVCLAGMLLVTFSALVAVLASRGC